MSCLVASLVCVTVCHFQNYLAYNRQHYLACETDGGILSGLLLFRPQHRPLPTAPWQPTKVLMARTSSPVVSRNSEHSQLGTMTFSGCRRRQVRSPLQSGICVGSCVSRASFRLEPQRIAFIPEARDRQECGPFQRRLIKQKQYSSKLPSAS